MKKYIFALGFFDGVHLGHQALLGECVQLARQLIVQPAAITFDSHPMAVLTSASPSLLTGRRDRIDLLRHFGMEHIVSLPTTKKMMAMDWQTFLKALLEQGAAGFVCGADFRFGHRGEGDAAKLQTFCAEMDLPCVIVPEQRMDGIRISSTHIRSLVEAGDMEAAAAFLGHPHILSGEVVTGRRLGRTIGVPTANLLIPEDVAVPRLGVYACRCQTGGKTYSAVTNIGSRPTVGGHQVRAESWILDFEGDLYGKSLTLEFVKFLRPEEKFADLEQLCRQIQADAARARDIVP